MSKNHLIVGLDIGSAAIKSLAASPGQENSALEILSQVSEKCLAVRRGVVVDVDETAQVISSVLKKTEKECNQKIEEVFINIGGSHLFSTNSHGTVAVSRADQKISDEDIDRVIQAAQTFSLPANREILNVFPKGFIVDGEKDIRHAIDMEGVRLETEILVLGYFVPYMKNLTKAVLNAGFNVAHIVASPLASARATLSPQEKELGVLLLDIGAGTTGFSVYSENVLLTAGVIPIGSFHITKDIATGLETDIETAEKIKLEYGSCLLKGAKKIKVKEDASGEILVFSQKRLGQIIDARVLEILNQAQKELKKINQVKLPGGAILCGGGANLNKIKDFAKKNLKMTCQLAKIKGFYPQQKNLNLACVSGLVLTSKDLSDEDNPSLAQTAFQKIKKLLKRILRSFVP